MQLELKRIQKSTGTTFVYVTHDQEEALTMSDRIAIMDSGQVQQLADPRSLYERPETSFVADFIGTSNALQVEITEPRAGPRGDGRRRTAPGSAWTAPQAAGESVQDHRPPGEDPDRRRRRRDPVARRVGTVIERIYLGSLSQVLVELPSGEQLMVHELNDDHVSNAEAGDQIELSWAARHSLVVDGDTPRMRLPVRALALLLAGALTACGGTGGEQAGVAEAPADPEAPATGTLSVFAYQDTVTDALLDPFREANPDLEVRTATFGSNQEAATKLAGGFEADVVEVCLDEMSPLTARNLLRPLDTAGDQRLGRPRFPRLARASSRAATC